MGVWGTGPFDNDGAADFLAYVEEAGARGWNLVTRSLRSHDPHEIVAAAELVATAMGVPTMRDQRTLAFAVGRQKAGPWARRYGHLMPPSAPALALSQVRRVVLRTDLGWSTPEGRRGWQSTVSSLIRRLSRGQGEARSSRSSESRPSRSRRAAPARSSTRRSRRDRRRTS